MPDVGRDLDVVPDALYPAGQMLASFRADAAHDRDELRTDLRARAERAEREADAYQNELAQLRAGTSDDGAAASRAPRRTRQAT
jgi:hypothetical protein